MGDSPASHTAALQEEIDELDRGLDSILRTDDQFRTSLRTLSRLCGENRLVPTRYRLPGLAKVGDDPPCAGGFADVYPGTYNGTSVALKVIRLHTRDRKTYMKVFCREAVVWKRLNHPNIVPFIGVEPGNHACIVSEWMDNGDIMSYLEDHPRANRIELIIDIARGLDYMHASGLVHGDLKSRNVLVDKIGRARLSDFGLATTILGTASLAATAGSSANWGSFCYMAPELNDHMAKNKILTSKSDVYAFGMTTWEIFDGRHPFYDIQNVFVILREVLDGTRPMRPPHAQDLGLDDFIWEVVISSCWLADPFERPDMSEVLAWLGPYNSAQGLVAKLVHEGLSDADRQVLDQLLFKTATALQRTMQGHTGDVNSVSFSPDGSQLASGSRDNTIRLWNADTGKEIREPLRGHTDWVNSVSFSPDGKCLASASDDMTVRLWDVQTGQQIGQPLEGHTDWVYSVAFSPDGIRIVSRSRDGTLRLWDAHTGQAIGESFRGHSNWVNSAAFSPDGKHIASGSSDDTIRLLDAETGQPVGDPLQGHDGWVWSVAYSPDGARIVSGSVDNTIRIWNAQTRQTVVGPLQGHKKDVNSVAFSPDGKYIVSGSEDGTMRIWDAQTGQTVAGPWEAHSGSGINSVAFSPDGKRVVSGGGDNMVKIWDAEID